jgi:F-type H+-transporting ATPase subunit b
MATTSSTGQVDNAASVPFPPFETHTFGGQLLWLAITFGALYFLMSRVVLPKLTGVIEARRTTIARDLDEAARMRDEAQAAGAAYEKALAEAKTRAQALAQETRDKLAAETDVKRKSLEADLGAKLAAAEATISARKAEAMGNVRAIAAEAATAIVERLTGRAPSDAAVQSALDA